MTAVWLSILETDKGKALDQRCLGASALSCGVCDSRKVVWVGARIFRDDKIGNKAVMNGLCAVSCERQIGGSFVGATCTDNEDETSAYFVRHGG